MKRPRRDRCPSAVHGVAALALAAAAALSTAAESPRILGDREFFTRGSFIAYSAPWSTYFGAGTAMKRGTDYADEIALLQPAAFPAHVEFSWHWPLVPPKHTGVYGYNALSFGSYDGGVPETPVDPRQVKAIGALSTTFRYSLTHPIGDFNVLSEFFLTSKAGDGKTAEIGFLLRPAKSAIAFAGAGRQLGTFVDPAGRAWKVARQPAPHGPFHMFLPDGEVLEGTLDCKAALDFLRVRGCVTGEEWFNGLALGIEPVSGSGSMRVERFTVDFR